MPYLNSPSTVHVHWIQEENQILVPDTDVVVGSWKDTIYGDSDAVLFDELDEIPQDGLITAIHHTDPGKPFDPFRVTLTDGFDPEVSDRHRLKFTASGPIGTELKAVLYEGAVIRAESPYFKIKPTMDTYVYTLTTTEADTITNYTNLEVRILPSGNLSHTSDSFLSV